MPPPKGILKFMTVVTVLKGGTFTSCLGHENFVLLSRTDEEMKGQFQLPFASLLFCHLLCDDVARRPSSAAGTLTLDFPYILVHYKLSNWRSSVIAE
jgi:hypothetical protein